MMKTIVVMRLDYQLPEQVYFSSMPQYGARKPNLGEDVRFIREQTGELVATGHVISQGNPYPECSTVLITERF